MCKFHANAETYGGHSVTLPCKNILETYVRRGRGIVECDRTSIASDHPSRSPLFCSRLDFNVIAHFKILPDVFTGNLNQMHRPIGTGLQRNLDGVHLNIYQLPSQTLLLARYNFDIVTDG